MNEERWGIVGGGMLGLSLALRLVSQGKHVTVLEGASSIGGLAGTWTIGDIQWDKHYHVTLLSDRALRRLIADIGLEHQCRWTQTKTGFFDGRRIHPLSDALDYLTLPSLTLIEKMRLAATIVYASKLKDWQALEKIPVIEWLTKLSGERVVNRLWIPLLKAKLGRNYELASAAFLWAVISRLYAARRTGLKKEMFGYVEGGYRTILERLEATLTDFGAEVKTSHRVRGAHPLVDGSVEVHCEGRHPMVFDRVVVTTPCPAVPHICPELTPEEQHILRGVKYQGILCASLLLSRPLSGNYLTYITDEKVPFTAVVEMSALVDKANLGGNTLVYLPKYVDSEDEAFLLSDEQLQHSFWRGLRRLYPELTEADVVAFEISRVRHVLAIPTLDYSKRVPQMETSIPNLFLVNSAQIVNGTLNVNETVGLAFDAAEKLLSLPAREPVRIRARA
ncbi:MAG: NAD(P)/FAD-dependent oxidoreductase [Bdellovibrionota bacterium]